MDGLQEAAAKNASKKGLSLKIQVSAVQAIGSAYTRYRLRAAEKKARRTGSAPPSLEKLRKSDKNFHKSMREFIKRRRAMVSAKNDEEESSRGDSEEQSTESLGLMVPPRFFMLDNIVVYDNCLWLL